MSRYSRLYKDGSYVHCIDGYLDMSRYSRLYTDRSCVHWIEGYLDISRYSGLYKDGRLWILVRWLSDRSNCIKPKIKGSFVQIMVKYKYFYPQSLYQ